MYDIVILGAGGMGRETFEVVEDTFGNDSNYRVKGFLSDVLDVLDGFENYPPLLGTIKDYQVQPNDRFILAIGDVAGRRKIAESILERSGEFINLIHPTAQVFRSAKIGRGVIIFPCAYVGADSKIGDFCLINAHALAGHDTILGNFSEMAPYSILGGGTQTGKEVFFCMHAVTAPKTKLGNRIIISQGSTNKENPADDSFVEGVPGKISKRRSADLSRWEIENNHN
jgi:sugar O-acyltransferase (sialic acid O-acetyltransferase NeuD family)